MQFTSAPGDIGDVLLATGDNEGVMVLDWIAPSGAGLGDGLSFPPRSAACVAARWPGPDF